MSRETFPARYAGRCAADCGQRIHEGDAIVWLDDGTGAVAHEDCAKDGAPPLSPAGRFLAPCAECHLVHAGECF